MLHIVHTTKSVPLFLQRGGGGHSVAWCCGVVVAACVELSVDGGVRVDCTGLPGICQAFHTSCTHIKQQGSKETCMPSCVLIWAMAVVSPGLRDTSQHSCVTAGHQQARTAVVLINL